MADATLENGNGPPHIEKDEEELAEFGYKQELKRDWGLTHNFGISFSIIVSSVFYFFSFFWVTAMVEVKGFG